MGLIVDNFAGGGGASTGLELALGRKVDIAINHDPDAIAMHRTNHPFTRHFQESVWNIDPVQICEGKEVDVAWFSPDCKHFSKAKGGKPVDKHIRGLAWIVLRWAGTVRPKVIFLENVEEFKTWGPVRRGRPVKSKAGQTFDKFVLQLKRLGYEVDHRELIAADYGAPTKRKRFFLIARCDGNPIVWPKATHAPRDQFKQLKLKPYRSAAEIIDWSIPCPSIFERKKPLSEATMKRIARGLKKFVLEEKDPFIVSDGKKSLAPALMVNNTGHSGSNVVDPISTITTGGHHFIITPYLIDYHFDNDSKSLLDPHNTVTTVRGNYMVSPVLIPFIGKPLPTITSVNKNYLCTAFIAKHFGGNYQGSGASLNESLPTITSVDHNALVEVKLSDCDHSKEVNAFLIKYYGGENHYQNVREPLHTITSCLRFGLITIDRVEYQIVDIGMRMLTPRELYNAQGFPEDYIIDKDFTGKNYPITKQIARCGNAVPPPFAEALARANLTDLAASKNFKTMKELKNYKKQLSLF